MNVLYIHQYYATPQSNGGVRSYHISNGLVDKGHTVDIITTSAFVPDNWEMKNGWNTRKEGEVTLHILYLPYSNKLSFLKRFWLFILFSLRSTSKGLRIKSDLVYATSTPLTIAIPGVIISKLKSVPLVLEIRDLWPDVPIAMGIIKNKFVIYLSKALERWAYKNASKIIALSDGMANGIREIEPNKKEISVVPNFSDCQLFGNKITKNHFLEKYPFLTNRKVVVYTGTFGRVNNLSYLIEVARHIWYHDQQVCFLFIGDGAEKQQLVNQAEQFGILDKSVYFCPPVSKETLPEVLALATLAISTVMPVKALWNNSANKFFDALAAGVPIGINHYGWQAETIEKYDIGVVMNPTNPVEGADSLLAFIQNHELLNEASLSCRKLALERFSKDEMVSKIESELINL